MISMRRIDWIGTALGIIIGIIFGVLMVQVMKKEEVKRKAEPKPIMQIEIKIERPTITPTPTSKPNKTQYEGTASYYSRSGCLGCSETMTMANGRPLNDDALTVAYNRAPLGSFIEVSNPMSGKSVVAEVTDRGGFESLGRIVDLTLAVKNAIDCGSLCQVQITHL